VGMSEIELYRRLGRAIAEHRSKSGLTQVQLAAQLNLSRASVANLESGRQRIMVHQLFALANALKLDSILELVPSTWALDGPVPKVNIEGKPLSAREQSGVQTLLASALADDRMRKRS